MSKSYNSFILLCALSALQKCHGVMEVPLQSPVVTSVLTPIGEDQNINFKLIPKLAQFYKYYNIKVIYVASYYGSGPSIPLPERKRLVKAWEEQANCYGFDLIVQVGAMPYVDTLELARYCSTLNVTAITTFGEIVYKATTLLEALEDMQRICDAAGNKLPLLYHELYIVNPNIQTDELFLGAKDGCVSCFVGTISRINPFLDIKAAVDSIAGYQLWIYGLDSIAAALKIGANATETINLFPDLTWKIKDAVDNCQLDLATDMQQDLNRKLYAITNGNRGGTADETTRTYFEREKAAFELLYCMDLGYREPLKRPNSTVFEEIRCNLEKLNVPLPLCSSVNNKL